MLALQSWLGLRARADPEGPRPGDVGRLVVEVTIPDGCHIESHEPGDPFLVPTVLELDAIDGVAIGAVQYPADEIVTFDWSPTTLRVYTGTVRLVAPFEVSVKAAGGRRRLIGRVRYQGCTETLCYPPAVQEVTASLQVV